jgi:hypothetical protein
MSSSALGIVDLQRYPVDDLDSPAMRSTLAEVHRQLQQDGCIVLSGFLDPQGLSVLSAEVAGLAPQAYFSEATVTVYGRDPEPEFPQDHPRRHELIRKNGFVAGDLIGAGTHARSLYHHPAFQQFLAACIGAAKVFEFADPLAQIVVNVVPPGHKHSWHFDSNDFVVTLMTQSPEQGGEFDYVPQIRTAGEENYSAVAATVRGDMSRVTSLDLKPGDLQLFFGRYSLHRVRETAGRRDRHTLVLAYSREAGVLGKAGKTLKLFGRKLSSHDALNARTRPDQLVD